MRVVFRTDASQHIGMGHLMRCLTLADELAQNDCEILFLCRGLPASLAVMIEQRGFGLRQLVDAEDQGFDWRRDAHESAMLVDSCGSGADWVVVDHYQLDRRWHNHMRARSERIMVIDDLANRPHDCDLLLDQNYYRGLEERYRGLVSANCRQLLGPRYVLLRPEFPRMRERMRRRDGRVRRLLVFFGGADTQNQTRAAVDAIQQLDNPAIFTDVVVGGSNPRAEVIRDYCEDLDNVCFHLQTSNMAGLIDAADLALCAGGANIWERCFLGLPTITTTIAQNQEQTTADVASKGAIEYLVKAEDIGQAQFVDALRALIAAPDRLHSISQKALQLVGGKDYLGTTAVAANLRSATATGIETS